MVSPVQVVYLIGNLKGWCNENHCQAIDQARKDEELMRFDGTQLNHCGVTVPLDFGERVLLQLKDKK
jgi:hypothetical protein